LFKYTSQGLDILKNIKGMKQSTSYTLSPAYKTTVS
jgi:hypothetical protein